MPSNDDFFATKRSAAVFKHGILKRYPVVFAAKTGMGNPVVFLDGYAGRGEYEDGTPGSPLLLSQCADFVKGYRNVRGFFVEQDEENFANLTRVLEEKGGATKRDLRQGSLDEHLPELLALAKGASLFAFLDPFGPALDFNLVRSELLGRPPWPRTEVLLHFSVLSVARMGRAVHVARMTRGHLSESDRKTADRLDRFLGADWWQEHFAKVTDGGDEERATDVALRVGQAYEEKMTAGTDYRAIRMPVRPRPDLAPKYVLILFTRSSEGAWHFADSLGQAGVEWEAAWYEDRMRKSPAGQETLFGDTPTFDRDQYLAGQHDRWVAAIAQNVHKLLNEIKSFRPAERVPEVYGDVLGQAWTKHVRAAVARLHAAGVVAYSGRGEFWKDFLRRP